MKLHNLLFILITLFTSSDIVAQKIQQTEKDKTHALKTLSIEPGIGVHTNFGIDLLFTNLIQWNPKKRLAFASHSSYNINNVTQRNFNGIKTEYNFSINQKFGVGTTFYSKKSSNTFLVMAGVKYTTFKESLVSPDHDKVSASIAGFSPDYGLMYSLKKGVKKYFFSFRAYVPLYPWPTKAFDISAADGNMNNIALEFGVGIKIK
jgi:hypothetical protein